MPGIAVKLPLSIDSVDGAYALHKDLKGVVQQNLKMLLLTIPGERVMMPDFGVGITAFLFESQTPQTKQIISERIHSQASKYMPFIEIKDSYIDATQDITSANPNMLGISIKYRVPALAQDDVLNLTIPINE